MLAELQVAGLTNDARWTCHPADQSGSSNTPLHPRVWCALNDVETTVKRQEARPLPFGFDLNPPGGLNPIHREGSLSRSDTRATHNGIRRHGYSRCVPRIRWCSNLRKPGFFLKRLIGSGRCYSRPKGFRLSLAGARSTDCHPTDQV
jgi:hypothetical protein